jgi:hypothetical protein
MGIPQKKEKNLKIWEAENSMHMKKEICTSEGLWE